MFCITFSLKKFYEERLRELSIVRGKHLQTQPSVQIQFCFDGVNDGVQTQMFPSAREFLHIFNQILHSQYHRYRNSSTEIFEIGKWIQK